MIPYEVPEPGWWPVARLWDNKDHAVKIWRRSYNAVQRALEHKWEKCPTCFGSGMLGSQIRGFTSVDAFACPTCKPWGSKGHVKWPLFGLEDLNGGWDCCPVCGEGQHLDSDVPCETCTWWGFKAGLFGVVSQETL